MLCARLEDPFAAVDLGGIAKGYIADRLTEMLIASGVIGCVVDLGGNIAVEGERPDGKPWKIALKAPKVPYGMEDPGPVKNIPAITIRHGSVVTSGIY